MGIISHQIDIQFTYHLIVIDFLFIKYLTNSQPPKAVKIVTNVSMIFMPKSYFVAKVITISIPFAVHSTFFILNMLNFTQNYWLLHGNSVSLHQGKRSRNTHINDKTQL